MDSVKHTQTTVPVHLQDAHYGGHEKLGKGIGYKYAHDYPDHYVEQQYLPSEIEGSHFLAQLWHIACAASRPGAASVRSSTVVSFSMIWQRTA